MNSSFLRLFAIGAAAVTAVCSVQGQVYTGNGNSGFGGPVGGGALTLSDDGTTLTGTISRGAGGNFNDRLVIYIDSQSGGFGSTASFADGADGLRNAISGISGTNRALLTFPTGFQADFAIALGPQTDSFGGLWTLAAGANNSLIFHSNANLTPTGGGSASATSFTFSISLASIGVLPGTGFTFVTTYLSGFDSFRSNESFGNSIVGSGVANPGFTDVAALDFATYGTPVIPEPTTVAFVLAGLGGLMMVRRRK